MFEELEKGQTLRALIAEILRQGPCSISQLAKKLKEPYNLDLHRLALAGYLRALADLGVLEEREIPPAKVYALKPGAEAPTLYDVVAGRIRQMSLPEPEATRVFVHVFHDLFHRPVFREEVRRAGFEGFAGLREAPADERQATRRLFSKSSLRLPFNDPAYIPAVADDAARVRDAARAVLAAVVRQSFHVESLAQAPRQTTLGGTA